MYSIVVYIHLIQVLRAKETKVTDCSRGGDQENNLKINLNIILKYFNLN